MSGRWLIGASVTLLTGALLWTGWGATARPAPEATAALAVRDTSPPGTLGSQERVLRETARRSGPSRPVSMDAAPLLPEPYLPTRDLTRVSVAGVVEPLRSREHTPAELAKLAGSRQAVRPEARAAGEEEKSRRRMEKRLRKEARKRGERVRKDRDRPSPGDRIEATQRRLQLEEDLR